MDKHSREVSHTGFLGEESDYDSDEENFIASHAPTVQEDVVAPESEPGGYIVV